MESQGENHPLALIDQHPGSKFLFQVSSARTADALVGALVTDR